MSPHLQTPIPEEILAPVRRKASRRVAAELVRLMADTDTSFEVIAKRLGKDEDQVRKWLYGFIDGHGSSISIMSDLAFSMGAAWEFGIEPYAPPQVVEEPQVALPAA